MNLVSQGGAWANIGWVVPIEWEILTSPVKPKDHIEKIAPLLPKKNSPIQSNGNGNQSCYLASIQDELGELLINIARPKNLDTFSSVENDMNEIEELKVIDEIYQGDNESTEKEQLIKARKGQGKFRLNVEKIESGCRVTKVTSKNLLIASHIMPWKVSSNIERLDGNNGLLLSPHIDKLFDRGWISFLSNGDLICASEEISEVLSQWGVSLPMNVGVFNIKQKVYLRFHRHHVFKG